MVVREDDRGGLMDDKYWAGYVDALHMACVMLGVYLDGSVWQSDHVTGVLKRMISDAETNKGRHE